MFEMTMKIMPMNKIINATIRTMTPPVPDESSA
jgi:hypothetical protein